ncbi:mitochondrial small ribosomal subunit Rsm22-domain-containing protein [Paraphysoderma sedebokerense]|nr:mitochondrial small ribosomal subunit Rsm22-domain-containing protein [Paraphysoderma sedebokerense]KAI9143569.1 mitochondrial small ribosomal subunit Rsm22-domain-containing protein [Paraphysoderma sedebokerense]
MPLSSRIRYMSTTISMRRFAPSIGTYIQNLRLSSTGRHFHNGSNHIVSEEAGTINNSPLNIVSEVKDKEVGDPNTRKPIFGLGMVILPDDLVSSIDTVLKSADKHHLRTDAMRIFESLRSTAGVKGNVVKSKSGKSVIDTGARQIPYTAEKTRQKQRNVPIVPHQLSYGNREVLAYLSCRMPATYASIYRVFAELRLLVPDFNPSSVLDFGTGPGTTLWALDRTFSKPIESVVAVDSNAEMILAAERLIQRRTEIRNDPDIESPPDVVKSVEFKRYLPVKENVDSQYDMVVSAFTLSELQNDSIRNSTIDNLWNMTQDVLVLIDRGTPSGYHHILHARERILKKSKSENDTSGANVLAPCLHSSACPMANSSQDWCHFAQRMQRPRVMVIL